MQINVKINDRNGSPIEIGDSVELFDWGRSEKSIGVVEIVWEES